MFGHTYVCFKQGFTPNLGKVIDNKDNNKMVMVYA